MRRIGLLLAGAGLWLFLAAIPALADGGPHVSTTNNGTSTLTADSCAGCHRAHTAQGPYLIRAASETLLCLTCHGPTSNGATVDVTTGVQYRPGSTYVRDNSDLSNQLGATRAGGFLQARLGDPARLTNADARPMGKVTVSATAHDVTSAHLQLPGSPITAQHVAWGNGSNGSGAGPTVELECTSCHNPHGNGQYRILNPLPEVTAESGSFTDPEPYDVALVNGDSTQEYIETTVGHQFFPGDLVTISGVAGITDGDYVVVNTPNGIRIKINTVASWPTTTAMNLTTAGPGGTVARTMAPVADVPLGTPDGNGAYPPKNYTVIQIQGTQGTDSTYLLYAQQIIDGGYSATDGDYWRRFVPWNNRTTGTNDAPNGKPDTVTAAGPAAGDVAFNQQMTAWCATCHTRYFGYQNPNPGEAPGTSTQAVRTVTNVAGNVITTSASHGFAVGDGVEILGLGADGVYYVATVPSSTTFTVTGGAFADDASPTATAQRVYPITQSAYFFPRVGDDLFKYQHSTRSNRVCTTCHVAHGSNAIMDGDYSSTLAYPGDTTPSDSSRLLKVGNRGTCTLCHDPTETVGANVYTGPIPTPGVP